MLREVDHYGRRSAWKLAIQSLPFLILLILVLPRSAAGAQPDDSMRRPSEDERESSGKPASATADPKLPAREHNAQHKESSKSKPKMELMGPHIDGDIVTRNEITVMGRVEGPKGTKVRVGDVKAEVRTG